MHELKEPLATSFRKGISPGNSSIFDELWFCKGRFCQSTLHVRVPNDCKYRLESILSFILVKRTCRNLSSNCPKTKKTSVRNNRPSYRGFKGSFELIGIRSFCRSCRSFLPPNGASEAKSPEVNVVELANRSQHAKLFRVQVLSFWVIVIYILRSHLPSNHAWQG